jgi:hypothetical protein
MSSSTHRSSLKTLAGLGLLCSIQMADVAQAIKTSSTSTAKLDAQIESLSAAVQKELAQSGELAGLMSESELASLVNTEVRSQVASEQKQTQKTNLEVKSPGAKKHVKKGKKGHKKSKHAKKAAAHKDAPPATSALVQASGENFDTHSMPVIIPIDEVKAITLKVAPTFSRDRVESVTLKSFRKVIGYDTFNSILKKDRDEIKDPTDHYNITVSMMVQRVPEDQSKGPSLDIYGPEQNRRLSQIIDKGFPYDDGDNSVDDQAKLWAKKNAAAAGTLVGKLNGENITSENLKNLVKDTEVPITQALVQTEAEINLDIKGDGDNVFKLMDSNVTKG